MATADDRANRYFAFGGDVRSLGEWRFEGGGFVTILVTKDIPTETAIEWVETLLTLKRDEMARRAAASPPQTENQATPSDDRPAGKPSTEPS